MSIITAAMKIEQLADAFVSREHEVANYQMNIDNYTIMLAALPQDEWPANLEQYKKPEPSKIDPDVDLATMLIINDYQYRDKLRLLLRTENCEMNKSKRVKDALEGQIPTATKDAVIIAAVLRRDAMLAKANA